MSRSFKKVCGGGFSGCRSDKEFKRSEHQRERSNVKQKLTVFMDESYLPHCKKYGDPWSSGKDGKLIYVTKREYLISVGNGDDPKDRYSDRCRYKRAIRK